MSEFLRQENIVPQPNPRDPGIDQITVWISEQIWGHRIWDSQSPWLLFLEFLTVAEACLREGRLFDEQGQCYPLTYKPYRRLHLRNILFNNEALDRIDRQYSDSHRAWAEWLRRMEEGAQGVSRRDFAYLRNRFASFHDFAALIATLRNSAVESYTNRRWSSRFVFPFGPDGLYEDLNVKPGQSSREYINFGRTGELLYQMLCRCQQAEALREPVANALSGKNRFNRLLKLLQPDEEEELHRRGYSYLPYIQHPSFNVLGEDWLNVFKLGLPAFDAFQHLVLLGAFHMLLYQLQTANWFCANRRRLYFVCEAIAPKKTHLRELSIVQYQENDVLSIQAVDDYISRIGDSDAWQSAIQESATEADAFTKCKEILCDKVWWGDDYKGPHNPDSLLKELREVARQGHGQHSGNVHRVYGRLVGLVSNRGTTRLRYAPNDALLKTLLIANVHNRMDLHEFLARLFERYGLIFGEHEAQRALPSESFDQKAFQANASRLERRLASMGMLRRLSDACAYVINPFAREQG